MKLEMTLPEGPGLLHAVPILNLLMLLIFFLLLGPSLILRSGVAVEMVPSRFQMQRYEDTLVITLGPGQSGAQIHLGRDPLTLPELATRLETLRNDGAKAKAIVLLQTDGNIPVATEREVAEMILDKGFRLAIVGKNAAENKALTPKPEP